MAETRAGDRGKAIARELAGGQKVAVGMAKPVRLTLSRRKGYNLQAASRAANGLAARTVARPGRWGNPFRIGRDGTQAQCASRYRNWLMQPERAALRREAIESLAGNNLACWCAPGTPCHADVLLAVVNPDA